MDTNWGNYDHDIPIRLNLRTSKIYVLDMQEMCSTPYKCGILLSISNTFTMLVESS